MEKDTDGELLEQAAKAIGGTYELRYGYHTLSMPHHDTEWKPHLDDGDALRLAGALKIDFEHGRTFARAIWYDEVKSSTHVCEVASSPEVALAATRRAIVCAAAEIGRQA